MHASQIFNILPEQLGIAFHFPIACRIIDQAVPGEHIVGTLHAVNPIGQRNNTIVGPSNLCRSNRNNHRRQQK